ncbi:protein phosphatase [Kitasatospora sp. NPDC006697]|uniref:protein-tyrosine phosphatase family protein n=1 Tax=Kitasatospora sp. NPDC006697 TaxID=3364020 RepID=UPI00369E5B1D
MPGLWIGGHLWADATGTVRPAVAESEFDLVVSLYDRAGHGPAPGVEHLVQEIPNGPLTASELGAVQELASATAQAVRSGRSVLVRCRYGYNRSGLVVAQALAELGTPVAEAISLIRDRRSHAALHNDVFVQYLTTGLDIARVLSSLDILA